jgi:hypothetical protein
MRRLEREHLTAFRECRFDFGERRTGAGGDYELGRLVVDDAAIGIHGKRGTLSRATVEVLAAAAADAQGRAVFGGLPNGGCELIDEVGHGKEGEKGEERGERRKNRR